MKRFFAVFGLALTLVSCGGGGGREAVSCRDYWNGTFGTCLPDDWIVIEPETLRQRGVPEDTVIAFQSQVAVSGQFPSVAVTREALAQVLSPADYSDANVRAVTIIPGYQEIDTQDQRIDGETVKLHIFTAQPVAEEPKRRFYQVSTVTEGVGFTITATVPVSFTEDVERQIFVLLDEATFSSVEE